MNIKFRGRNYRLKLGAYTNKRIALTLLDPDTWEQELVATVNLPDTPMEYDQAAIKDYSENEGIWNALEEHGIIIGKIGEVKSGFVSIPIAKLNLDLLSS